MALIIKKSQLPNAGKGLFTNKCIRKGAKIIEYRGELIGYREYRLRAKKAQDHYLFCVHRNLYIDAMHTKQYKGRYANDAEGLSRIKGLRNNCDFMIYNNKCYIVASANIKAGEEIFVNYTKPYWDYIRKRMK